MHGLVLVQGQKRLKADGQRQSLYRTDAMAKDGRVEASYQFRLGPRHQQLGSTDCLCLWSHA